VSSDCARGRRAEAIAVTVRADGGEPLSSASIDVRVGELLAVVGASGAGKSTLLRVLAGDVPPTSGEVRIAGRDARLLRPRERALLRAVLPQNASASSPSTVREAVRFGRAHYGRVDQAADSVVAEVLSATGTAHLATRVCAELTVDQRSRVALARLLAQRAPLLLLDEPVAALDPEVRAQVLRALRDRTNRGDTVVLALTDLGIATEIADRVAILEDGRVRPLDAAVPAPRVAGTA
jgi:iron complex transport system ATP-binding protein